MGIAAFYHGSGFTGSGEVYLNSLAGIDVTPEGKVRVLVSNTEFGQGTNTILTQIAAEALGIDYDDVTMAAPDTGMVPNSGPTVASRTSMVVGRLIERACLQLIALLARACRPWRDATRARSSSPHASAIAQRMARLLSLCRYEAPPGHLLGRSEVSRRSLSGAYAWAVYVAQVAVDTVTYSAEVEDFWAVQEVGRVLHPVLAAGQIEGGIAQGIGYALYEKVVLAGWPHGQQPDDQLHHAHRGGCSADSCVLRGDSFPLRRIRRQGHWRIAARRPRAGDSECHSRRDGRCFNSIPLLPEDLYAGLAAAQPAEETAAR